MKTILSILAATALITPGAMARVDEGFGQPDRLPGVPFPVKIIFAPLMPFIELQSTLSPEKVSCWNDGAENVVGCNLVDRL